MAQYSSKFNWRAKSAEFPLVKHSGGRGEEIVIIGTAASVLSLFACLPALLPEFFRDPKSTLAKSDRVRKWTRLIARTIEFLRHTLSVRISRDTVTMLESLTRKIAQKLVFLRADFGIPKVHYFMHIPEMIKR